MSEAQTHFDVEKFENETCAINRPDLKGGVLDFLIDRSRKISKIDINELTKYTKKELFKKIRKYSGWIQSTFGDEILAQFEEQVQKFEDGKINLYELHAWTVHEIFSQHKVDSHIAQESVRIKNEIFGVFKMIASGYLSKEGWKVANHAIDELNNPEISERDIDDAQEEDEEKSAKQELEEDINEILTKILKFLKTHSNIKGVRIEYQNPFSGEPNEINQGDVEEGENNHKYIGEMQFGKRKIGKLEFIFDRPYKDELIEAACESITDEIDTYLDSKLQTVLERHIDTELEGILERHFIHDWNNLSDWRAIFREFFAVAQKALPNSDMIFCYKRDDLVTSGKYGFVKVVNGELSFDDFDEDCTIPELREKYKDELVEGSTDNVEVHPFAYKAFLDREYLTEKGYDATECERMGALIATCQHSTDEKIAQKLAGCFQRTLERREDLRGRFSQIVGLNIANALFDKPTEKWAEREIALAVGDINAYTLFSEAVKEREQKDPNTPKHLLPEIMDYFTQEINFRIERNKELQGTVISQEGDSIIVYFGAPADDQDLATYANNALEQCAEIQKTLDEVLGEIERKYKIKLPWLPRFSYGVKAAKEVAGIFGNPKNPYTKSQYTVYGKEINEAARIQKAAPKGSILMDHKTYLLIKDSGRFVAIGLPYLASGKNVKDPMPVILVTTKEKSEKNNRIKEEVLGQKSEDREVRRKTGNRSSILFFNEKSYKELPDGDYDVKSEGRESKGPRVLSLVSEPFAFPVCIPRDAITPATHAVSPEIEKELEEQFAEKLYSQREILRKEGDKFTLIRHVSIEEMAEIQLREIIEENKRNNRKYFEIEQLPAGTYKILELSEGMIEENTDYYYFFLLLGDTPVRLRLKKSENHLRGVRLTKGIFIHEKGFCECKYVQDDKNQRSFEFPDHDDDTDTTQKS